MTKYSRVTDVQAILRTSDCTLNRSLVKLSIAMCTYNGAQFLSEQLASLQNQQRQPDEIIICDDRSTDKTVRIIERWARDAPCDVRICVNDKQLGSTRNFEKAISLCSGDLISLCDQDDVWLEHKLSEAEAAFLSDPTLGAWFTDALLVDETLNRLPVTLWERVGFTRGWQYKVGSNGKLRTLLRRSFITGATLVFPARYRDLVLPIPPGLQFFIHDRWIATLIAAVAPISFSDRPSMLYRQHRGQQLGVSYRPTLDEKIAAHLSRHEQLYRGDLIVVEAISSRLKSHAGSSLSLATLDALDGRERLLRMRTSLPPSRRRRLGPVLRALLTGQYSRYGEGLPSGLKDLLL
jgi:glycosyltransferase involved in cell wall biosynthesis